VKQDHAIALINPLATIAGGDTTDTVTMDLGEALIACVVTDANGAETTAYYHAVTPAV